MIKDNRFVRSKQKHVVRYDHSNINISFCYNPKTGYYYWYVTENEKSLWFHKRIKELDLQSPDLLGDAELSLYLLKYSKIT